MWFAQRVHDENADGSNADPDFNKAHDYRTLFPESIVAPHITSFTPEIKNIKRVNWSNYAERY
jgi:hypothetical protein